MTTKRFSWARRAQGLLMAAACTLGMVALASCSETGTDNEEFANWQSRNDTYFNSVYAKAQEAIKGGSTEWKIFRKWSLTEEMAKQNHDHVVVQVLEQGTGSGCPLYTDSVMVHYKGRLIPSASFINGAIVGSSYEGEFNKATAHPVAFPVNNTITMDGICTALQQMHIGDRWRIFIPYQLALGGSAYKGTSTAGWITYAFPAYSGLIYEISLAAYYRTGEKPGEWKAKPFVGEWVTE
ncbi:MAG: FKBP-type peptidyl-prolyl cis-trans isomerase [Prevotellaceae bacterium]|nr:FKBP-type peptidyl-prolyl cis-trans isomerase [Prevotella sp.]MDD7256692.1 FKBP-type peptidyl-prolyl cis-trans isomerase [Prevotellaceae bacterium]MDY6129797.1 FKBP-type peptidyl-prolyl cis-trans isomerase [Prevotella sp.]